MIQLERKHICLCLFRIKVIVGRFKTHQCISEPGYFCRWFALVWTEMYQHTQHKTLQAIFIEKEVFRVLERKAAVNIGISKTSKPVFMCNWTI